MLTKAQVDFFWEHGYLVVEQAVSDDLLARLRRDFTAWVEESRSHSEAYGETLDGRPRFDLEAGHQSEKPALRRVNAPIEVSDAYFEAMASSKVADCVADLIGPNIKLHHTKINSKLPGAATVVKWHQNFPFTPHSNDDLVTALLMVDEVTAENGPLEVAPGSHRETLHSLWHDGVFTGAVADDVAEDCKARSELCMGKAGSVCLMHTRLLHGSTANRSTSPRTLFIAVYAAEDALSHVPNPVPTQFEGMIISGEKTNRVRSIDFQLELPQKPSTASFFDQQAKHEDQRTDG
ncbi:MAG: phytanoyl-CoA dioxygenase family protein [Geminicoccaceae bacterium]